MPGLASEIPQPLLTQGELRAVKILLQPLPDQRTIAAVLGGVDATVDVAREEAAGLRLLKESTADALLTGRVSIGH